MLSLRLVQPIPFMIPILEKSKAFGARTAIIDAGGSYSYNDLAQRARQIAGAICSRTGGDPVPVLFLFPSGFDYVAVQWAIWMAGAIAVPVHTAHPPEEIAYLAEDTGTKLLLYDIALADKVAAALPDPATGSSLEQLLAGTPAALPAVAIDRDALMIYTSGTTGRPKGVVMSHRQLDSQMRSLSEAWGWCADDRILNVLPMHHVHGVVNITCCALYNGATVELQAGFDPAAVASRMRSGTLTLFMAVPTIYHKLIQHFEQLPERDQKEWQEGMHKMRLMISGSAALPVPVLERWQAVSGHILLERYGMTEIGMALSNSLNGTRKPGYVGYPLPLVSVKLADENGQTIATPDTPGELYIKGDTVFKRYWNRPEETAASFEDGWFKTGDIAERNSEGCYRILGRHSSDIIKSGGYKISALEIEQVLLGHPEVEECAVIALPSEEWGETIAAVITGQADHQQLKDWLKDKLAPYKIPRQFMRAESLPRNAMGKVLKQALKEGFRNGR